MQQDTHAHAATHPNTLHKPRPSLVQTPVAHDHILESTGSNRGSLRGGSCPLASQLAQRMDAEGKRLKHITSGYKWESPTSPLAAGNHQREDAAATRQGRAEAGLPSWEESCPRHPGQTGPAATCTHTPSSLTPELRSPGPAHTCPASPPPEPGRSGKPGLRSR